MSSRSDLRCSARLIEELRRMRLKAKNWGQRGRSGHPLVRKGKNLAVFHKCVHCSTIKKFF